MGVGEPLITTESEVRRYQGIRRAVHRKGFEQGNRTAVDDKGTTDSLTTRDSERLHKAFGEPLTIKESESR